jgi:hypothetical protein
MHMGTPIFELNFFLFDHITIIHLVSFESSPSKLSPLSMLDGIRVVGSSLVAW